jgi:hypothetical protein
LAVCEADLDIGEVWSQRDFSCTLNVQNPGREDREVLEIKTSCECTSAAPSSFVVPAGGTVPVQVRLDLWPRSAVETSQAVRPFTVELTPVVRRWTPISSPWQLHGRVRRHPLVPQVWELDFGGTLVHGFPFPAKIGDVACQGPLAGITAGCDGSLATVRVLGPNDNGKRCQLEIALRPDLPLGEHRFDVFLKPVVAGNDLPAGLGQPPELHLAVRAVVNRDIYVMPADVSLGAVRIGDSAEQVVSVRSLHNRPFEVLDVKMDGPDGIEVKPAGKQDGARLFQIVQRASKSGVQVGRIRFLVKEADGQPPYELSVTAAYHGFQDDSPSGGTVGKGQAIQPRQSGSTN